MLRTIWRLRSRCPAGAASHPGERGLRLIAAMHRGDINDAARQTAPHTRNTTSVSIRNDRRAGNGVLPNMNTAWGYQHIVGENLCFRNEYSGSHY